MKDWIEKLNGFLQLNERNILEHAGKISHEMAKDLAETVELYRQDGKLLPEPLSGREFVNALQGI